MRYIPALLIWSALIASSSLAVEIFPPVGDHAAELMVISGPKEAEEIMKRMKKALAADPAWLKSYFEEKKPKPGESLPYHEKFGISKKEYDLVVQSIGKLTLNKVADVIVRVKKTENKVFVSIEGADLLVNAFEFGVDGKSMTCAKGSTMERAEINQTNAAAPTGKWSGTKWVLEQGILDPSSKDDCLSLSIGVGVDDKGRNMIYLRIVGRQQGQIMDIAALARWPKE